MVSIGTWTFFGRPKNKFCYFFILLYGSFTFSPVHRLSQTKGFLQTEIGLSHGFSLEEPGKHVYPGYDFFASRRNLSILTQKMFLSLEKYDPGS